MSLTHAKSCNQREDRVAAHILVRFLAYVLWKTLEQWQSRAGLRNSQRTELGAIQSTDIVLPTATSPQRELRLRYVVRPDRHAQPGRVLPVARRGDLQHLADRLDPVGVAVPVDEFPHDLMRR